MVDVVIPLYRPDAGTGILLRRLLKQDYEINRIILINTEKEYFNEELLFDPVIEVHHITKPEFDHGATRHMGMELSDADYVLFLTMDAIPADTHLISSLVKCFEHRGSKGEPVAVAYGRQLASKKASFEEKYTRNYLSKYGDKVDPETLESFVNDRLYDELKSGVQTIQYQINTLMTTNGQSPFVTLFLNLKEDDPYKDEVALIIEEILKQRIQGIKNEAGVYITPAFPKLIYVLDEHNCLKGGKYDYLTKLAVECSSKRMYPDYISAKKMRENYEGEVFSCMGCRSFLSPWKDENGNYKWEGRFNQGVVSINLPQMGIIANGNEELFWELMEERLSLCFEALMCRHKALEGTLSDVSPIHWQYGAIARLKPGETIDPLLHNGYSTISLGYIGLYEVTKLMTGVSHTDPKGTAFALKVMNRLREACDTWKRNTGLGFGLYGTPAESLCYRFAEIDKKRFGEIEDVTDKGYYSNSYHVDVREKIDAFSKFEFEAQFQVISSGGAISYVEVPNMQNNLPALEEVVKLSLIHI